MSIEALVEQLKDIVGPQGWKTDPMELEPYVTEWRDAVRGITPIVVFPGSTAEVSAVVSACATAGVAIVPQAGNTGLCGGAIPDMTGEQIILNVSRLNRIREVQPLDFSIVVEAGCVLADIQAAAADVDRYFPLSLGAEGSCEIGGNLSTNAGGLNVIRHGTARNLVLGLEVVLADGRVLNGLKTLRKDTAGYDLKHCFIGSEGTLGIITAAALKLMPRKESPTLALLACDQAGTAVSILADIRKAVGDQVEAFELISSFAFELVERHIPDARLPFDDAHPWYVLLEVSGRSSNDALVDVLAAAAAPGKVLDAVIAKNDSEAQSLWRLRHSISEAQKRERTSVKHDISIPIGRMQEFLSESEQRLAEELPQAEPVIFGHVGDGNLHYNIMFPADTDAEQMIGLAAQASHVLYELVASFNGSFSAEHGVGQMKRDYLIKYADPVALELMRRLKKALDPANIFNPGKVI